MNSAKKNLKRAAALAAFAALWGGCSDESSVSGSPCDNEDVSSSSETVDSSSSEATESSSDSKTASSSSMQIIDGPIQGGEIDMPIALYGPPCMFDGSCLETSSSSTESSSSVDKGSSSSESFIDAPALYGPPCVFDNSCFDNSDSLKIIEEVEVDMPIALYGPPCVFDNSCDSEIIKPVEETEPENE